MRRHVAILVGVVVSLAGLGLGAAERRQEKFRASVVDATRVDMGVTLVVVRKDPRNGEELIPGLPRMKQIGAPIRLGGMVEIDAKGARYAGPSLSPVVWHASEQQADMILHDAPANWQLIEGSEGSNKTTTLVRWVALRVLENVGRKVEGGITGPTHGRLDLVKQAIDDWWPTHWFSFSERYQMFRFHAGPRVRLVSAVQRSKQAGSPIQGFNWWFCASDEMQDHTEREADILARGRSARGRGYMRLCTSTPKDDATWRNYRAAVQSTPKDGAPQWRYARMLGMESPFVADDYWMSLRASGTYTERDWRRRVLAQDVGPERQVYFNWRRTFDNGNAANLRAIPDGARDVTAEILAPWLGNASVLVGHDPGERQQVSVLLKAFILPGQRKGDDRPRWFVVDEITSPESTIHAHAQQVLARLRSHWNCHAPGRDGRPDPSSPVALVRIDPHTRGGEGHPGSDVATIWKALGMVARAAAYKAASVEPVTIKRRQRIDLVNTLLSATADVGEVRRLFVATRSGFLWPDGERDGKPAAPQLVKAFETMEFNEAGQAERERKDADDLSHWPAALGYALWNVEAPRLGWKAEAA